MKHFSFIGMTGLTLVVALGLMGAAYAMQAGGVNNLSQGNGELATSHLVVSPTPTPTPTPTPVTPPTPQNPLTPPTPPTPPIPPTVNTTVTPVPPTPPTPPLKPTVVGTVPGGGDEGETLIQKIKNFIDQLKDEDVNFGSSFALILAPEYDGKGVIRGKARNVDQSAKAFNLEIYPNVIVNSIQWNENTEMFPKNSSVKEGDQLTVRVVYKGSGFVARRIRNRSAVDVSVIDLRGQIETLKAQIKALQEALQGVR